MTGKLDLRTINGSLHLTDAGGDVHARTQNGSVRLAIPESYAALVETGTVNGRVIADFQSRCKDASAKDSHCR